MRCSFPFNLFNRLNCFNNHQTIAPEKSKSVDTRNTKNQYLPLCSNTMWKFELIEVDQLWIHFKVALMFLKGLGKRKIKYLNIHNLVIFWNWSKVCNEISLLILSILNSESFQRIFFYYKYKWMEPEVLHQLWGLNFVMDLSLIKGETDEAVNFFA